MRLFDAIWALAHLIVRQIDMDIQHWWKHRQGGRA